MNITAKTTGLALMLPAALNPAVAAAISIGLVGFGIYRLFGNDAENRASEALPEPSLSVASTIAALTSDGSGAARTVCVERSFQGGPQHTDLDQQNVGPDEHKQKIIREAMSELGKRSAAARARKKQEH